ncbi:hypothetical protein [Saccharothrix xinjiangensis]|uniref:Uncharacterized protein n=1 Tax=Saccharothrix xinjiangensis TaxID=204798 RepID=A0ABV9Y5C4_9PSEU
MVHRRALTAPAAATGALALLLTGACGKPTAAPEPVVVPTTTSSSAPVTSVPAVADISVPPTTTTPTTTVAATTEPPPPPPPPPPAAPVQPEPRPEPTTAPTTEPPGLDEVAFEGFPCEERGATAVDPTGRALVCDQGRRGWLRWERAR